MNKQSPDNMSTKPIDPQLEKLLDEALAPKDVPADLAQRITDQTTPLLQQPAPAVVGRIGWLHWTMRIAAMVVIAAALVAIIARFGAQPTDETPPVVLTEIGQHLDALAAADERDSALIDAQIEMVAMQLDLKQTESLWHTGKDPIAEAAAEAQMDRLSYDSYLVF